MWLKCRLPGWTDSAWVWLAWLGWRPCLAGGWHPSGLVPRRSLRGGGGFRRPGNDSFLTFASAVVVEAPDGPLDLLGHVRPALPALRLDLAEGLRRALLHGLPHACGWEQGRGALVEEKR